MMKGFVRGADRQQTVRLMLEPIKIVIPLESPCSSRRDGFGSDRAELTPEDERRGAAIHEAGHAVVAWALGLRVFRLVIAIDGDITAGKADIEQNRSSSLVDRIALCAAGGDAQELFDAPTNDICAISDMIKIYDL